MEFDKSRVFTALNADELKIGSKVIVGDTLEELKYNVANDYEKIHKLERIDGENEMYRFILADNVFYMLAYLVEEPQLGLKWQDLKIGDIIRNKNNGLVYMITGIDGRERDSLGVNTSHIAGNGTWITDDRLPYWELA